MADPTWDDTEEVAGGGPSFEETSAADNTPPTPTGPVSMEQSMAEELEGANWWDKMTAGLGTALKLPVQRLKQLGVNAPTVPRAMIVNPKTKAADIQDIERQRQIAATGPGMAGNVIGNVGMAAPAIGAAPLVAGARMATLPAAARVGARVLTPVAAGAGTMAATQPTLPGESEVDQAILGGVAGGAGAGAAASLPHLVKGARALLGPLTSSGAKATREAVERLVKAMEQDGLDPAATLKQAADLAQSTGKPLTLADVIGDDVAAVNTRKLFQEALGTAEGKGRAELLRGVAERATGQRERVLGDISETLGTSKVPRSEAFEELARTKAEAAKPLYDAAFANKQPIVDERLVKMWERPSMVSALKEVIKDAAERGTPIHTAAWSGDPAKVPKALLSGKEFKEGVPEIYAPTVEMLDKVKKKLYDIEQAAFKTSEVSGKPVPTQTSNAIGDTRRALTKLLDDDLAPMEYRQARKIWGDYSEMEQSFKQGSTLFKHDPAVIKKIIKEATPAERDAFASGIFAHINEMTSKEGLDWAGNNLLRDTRKMAQLRAAFGETEGADEAFKQFEKRLKAESMAMRSARTYPPTGRSMHAAGMSPGEVIAAGADMKSAGALSTLMAMLRRASGASMSKGAAGELGRIGFTPMTRAAKAAPGSFAALSRHVPQDLGALGVSPAAMAVSPLEALRTRRREEE